MPSVSSSRKLRIQAGHYYVLADYPGISGFRDWSRKVECIVTADKARNNRLLIDREFVPTGAGKFRLADGHLPECQPVVDEAAALLWLDVNTFQSIAAV